MGLIRREALEKIIMLATKELQVDSELCVIDEIMDTKDTYNDKQLREMFADSYEKLIYYDDLIKTAVKDEYKAP